PFQLGGEMPESLHGHVEEQVVLVLEVQVDGGRRVPRGPRHLAQGKVAVALLGEELHRRVEDGPPRLLCVRPLLRWAGPGWGSPSAASTTAWSLVHDGAIILNSVNQ